MSLIQIFEENTDENHGITMPQLIELLWERGIVAERKALYRDIKVISKAQTTHMQLEISLFEYDAAKEPVVISGA